MRPSKFSEDKEQPFKFNPRAPPFLPGAIEHPPLLASDIPPPNRDLNFIQNAPHPAWQQYALRVAHAAPPAAHNQYAYHVHPGYPHYTSTSELPKGYLALILARGNVFTRAGYNGGYQGGMFQAGNHVVNNPEAYQVPVYASRPAPYFFDGNALWSASVYGHVWPQGVQGQQQQHGYQQRGYQQHVYQPHQHQYVYASSPQHAADHFARRNGIYRGMKGKGNKAWQKKGRGGGWRGT